MSAMVGTKRILIGVDVGVKTGIAIYDRKEKELLDVRTVKIHQAFDIVKRQYAMNSQNIEVYFEDARKRVWFGNSGREKLQGAGSVKRDSKIWEDFLTDYNISFQMIPPSRNTTKLNAKVFKVITKYNKQTNEHGRDAAMLVYGK